MILTALIFAGALLYSSVGHGGASGYLAAMALFGLAPEVMKPAALTLNILVTVIASIQYYRSGCFSWPVFWPLALASIPCAFLGGFIVLPSVYYKPLVGVVLLFAAWRFMQEAQQHKTREITPLPFPVALFLGAGIGFLSGLTGVGGGIFLSPLLILNGWAQTRLVSGVSAVFILVNSTAGLMGVLLGSPQLPAALPYWAIAAAVGGFIGAHIGSRRLSNPGIQRLLALVLAVAGFKMILTASA